MLNVYLEFLYWGFLGLVNLAVSILIYHSTKHERKQQLASEYEMSTRTKSIFSLPCSFTYINLFTGVLNTSGAYLRCRRIHFLEIPTIPWLVNWIRDVDGGDKFLELLEAKWLVAMNDWTSLFLAFTFLLAGCYNFATVRQLRLRDQSEQENLLPTHQPYWHGMILDQKMRSGLVSGQGLMLGNEKPSLDELDEEDGSIAVVAGA